MTIELPPRLPLALLPTPLESCDRLAAAWGGPQIWMKRDDLTGFEMSGNKVRKLEFHFAAARRAGADTVITCGATQSNHCRATALAAARLGLRCIVYLRHDGDGRPALSGNFLLAHLGGAQVRLITAEQWQNRDELMADAADQEAAAGHPSWVIPEGASDALGMWGYVLALREVADQAARIPGTRPIIWHAASSGGTTAGIGWGVDRLSLDFSVVACSIGDPADEIRRKVEGIWEEAAESTDSATPSVALEYVDDHIGAGYGIVSDDELSVQVEATRHTGVILDPTYTGKAMTGLRREIERGRFSSEDNVVFWHTGGGFAALAHDFSRTAVAVDPGAGNV